MESAMSADDDNPPAKDDENKYAVFHNSPQNDYLYKKILNTIGLSFTTRYITAVSYYHICQILILDNVYR